VFLKCARRCDVRTILQKKCRGWEAKRREVIRDNRKKEETKIKERRKKKEERRKGKTQRTQGKNTEFVMPNKISFPSLYVLLG
jgi:type IV secretory pathway VirB9-like protein